MSKNVNKLYLVFLLKLSLANNWQLGTVKVPIYLSI